MDVPVRASALFGLVRSEAHKPEPCEQMTADLFLAHRDSAMRYLQAFRLPPQACEEIVQQTFIQLFLHLREGKPRDNLTGWIFRVAHNQALKWKARDEANRFLTLDAASGWCADPEPDAEQQMIDSQRRRRLLAVVEALGEKERQCLFLRAEGLRYRAIAELLGVSIGTVSNLLARALDRLRRADERSA